MLLMLEAEFIPGAESTAPTKRTEVGGDGAELNAENLLATALADSELLSKEEEKELACQIVRARKRIRTVLRKGRRIARAALAGPTRGVISPDQDFREQETLAILNYARGLCRTRSHRLPFSQPELKVFVTELSEALADYRALRDQMVRANVRLVSMMARNYHHPHLTFLDLFQEGVIGLLRAVEKYEPGRNVKFSTYATWWIWQRITRSADTDGALIRTPVHWNQLRRRVQRGMAGDGPGSRDHIAGTQGIDAARFDEMAQPFRFVSTDAPASDEYDHPLESMLPGNSVDPEAQAFTSDLRRQLDLAIDELPEREGQILRERFGLDNDQPQTLEEIGVRFGVSRERIRQLENRALRQLKRVCRSMGLTDYLN